MRFHSRRSSAAVVCWSPVCTPNFVILPPRSRSSDGSRVGETRTMPRATVLTTNPDTIEIEYETFGSPFDPALLLVMGFTAQLIAWDTAFCELLAARGHHV